MSEDPTVEQQGEPSDTSSLLERVAQMSERLERIASVVAVGSSDRPLIELSPGVDVYGTWQGWAALCGALGEATKKFGTPAKDKEVTIQTKTGGTYTFRYATMAELKRCTDKALAEHGLSVLQPPSRPDPGRPVVVTTMLVHESGAMLCSRFVVVPQGSIKDLGGDLTYVQRYAFSKLLNLSGDEDADDIPDQSRGEQGAESRQRTAQPKSPEQTKRGSTRGQDQAVGRGPKPSPKPEKQPDPPYSADEKAQWEADNRAAVDARNAAAKGGTQPPPAPGGPDRQGRSLPPEEPPPPSDEDALEPHVEPEEDQLPSEELNWEIRNLLQANKMRAADVSAFVQEKFGVDVAALKGSARLAEGLRDALKRRLEAR